MANWGLIELVESAVHAGELDLAADAFERLSEMTSASGTEWALGIESRSRALLNGHGSRGPVPRSDRQSRPNPDPRQRARAHLMYGEWLRSQDRRLEARQHLCTAHDQLAAVS